MQPRYCRVRATEAERPETTCVTRFRAYEFPVVQFSLTNAKGGKCSVQKHINMLGHVVEFHQIKVEKRKITTTCDGRIQKSVTELPSCPGLANSNEQFVEGFLKKRTSSLTELFKEEDIQWGGNLECQTAFDGLKQATIERPSLGVADATKPPKVEAEKFNYMLEEYLHHFVDGTQRNWVQMLNVAQFDHDA